MTNSNINISKLHAIINGLVIEADERYSVLNGSLHNFVAMYIVKNKKNSAKRVKNTQFVDQMLTFFQHFKLLILLGFRQKRGIC